MDRLIDALLSAMDENTFMLDHEKKKVKEVSKTIKQLEKINENIENKVDIEPHMKEFEQHLKQLTEHKQEQKKLNKIFRILTKEENNEE